MISSAIATKVHKPNNNKNKGRYNETRQQNQSNKNNMVFLTWCGFIAFAGDGFGSEKEYVKLKKPRNTNNILFSERFFDQLYRFNRCPMHNRMEKNDISLKYKYLSPSLSPSLPHILFLSLYSIPNQPNKLSSSEVRGFTFFSSSSSQ